VGRWQCSEYQEGSRWVMKPENMDRAVIGGSFEGSRRL